jgi:hypothetical protein
MAEAKKPKRGRLDHVVVSERPRIVDPLYSAK